MAYLWGIDLGGTKIEAAVIRDNLPLDIVVRRRIATEAEGGYEHILHRIRTLVESIAAETGMIPDRIGMGTPGTIDPIRGTLKNSNTVCLNGTAFGDDVQSTVKVPVMIANDANCFALAETHFGAAAQQHPNARVVFGVIMGTGVGGGIVVDGNVLQGPQGIAGEWGHNVADEAGDPCYCGKRGCVETVISGPALERYYLAGSGMARRMPEIVQRYHEGIDTAAQDTMQRLFHFFGKSIAIVVNILDPDVIVLGGGIGNIEALYTEGVAAAHGWIFNDRMHTPVIRPMLGDSAGVIGAALLTLPVTRHVVHESM